MNDVLMVMQGREIPECMDSIMVLKIPKMVFRGYTEMQLASEIPKFINETNYDNYIIISDDTICNQEALDVVREGLTKYEAFTGWCPLAPNMEKVTLCYMNLTTPKVTTHSYHFYTRKMVFEQPGYFQTTFMGWALSGMRKALWQKVPFWPCMPRKILKKTIRVDGWGSDYSESWRLQKLGIKIFTHPKAEIIHLATMRNSIMGCIPSKKFWPFSEPQLVHQTEEQWVKSDLTGIL